MRVIGTAGHVDHGKSTLVAALTGTHPDRLKEEQEREMTIDLGFAWLTLPGGDEIGIVDVPGHRDFIENMLAGVGGIDAAMLVIAADEGIMPQTREHLAIIDLLQIKAGLVALTKIDLVEDREWLDLMEADIRVALSGTVLENAPILPVSARSRAGLPELLDALDRMLQYVPQRQDLGKPRLPVDRVFSIAGFGTVVTGTLSDGHLTSGDEVEVLPSHHRGRIRGLQTHKKKENIAVPGSRTAINISGLDVEQIHRGDVITLPGQYQATQRMDVQFRLLPDVSAPLRHHTEVKIFNGTSETLADLRLLGVEILNPGEVGWLQLELHSPVLAGRGDRYILRRPSPGETLGGGSVVDPHPKNRHKRFDAQVIQALEKTARGDPVELLIKSALTLGPAQAKDVVSRSGLDDATAQAAIKEALESGKMISLDDVTRNLEGVIVAESQWRNYKESILSALGTYHQAYPLRRGMPREELKSRIKLMPRPFNLILSKLGAEGLIIEEQKWAALPGHQVLFSPFQQTKVDQLMRVFIASPGSPPSVKECVAEVGEEIFNILRASGDLICVSDDVVFRSSDFQTYEAMVRNAIQKKGRITLAEVRDLLSTSRKYVQPLLEYMDSLGITIRDGDFRKLK